MKSLIAAVVAIAVAVVAIAATDSPKALTAQQKISVQQTISAARIGQAERIKAKTEAVMGLYPSLKYVSANNLFQEDKIMVDQWLIADAKKQGVTVSGPLSCVDAMHLVDEDKVRQLGDYALLMESCPSYAAEFMVEADKRAHKLILGTVKESNPVAAWE